MNKLQKNILEKINIGEIDMKPKWHFVLRSLLFTTGTFMVAVLLVYLLSFVFFFMRQTGVVFAPAFGLRGMSLFLFSSPWLLIILSTLFFFILYLLVTYFSISYKRPLIYTLLGVIVFALLGAGAVQRTLMHDRIGAFMERHAVPVFAPLYQEVGHKRPDGIIVGVVRSLIDEGFVIETEDGDISQVRITSITRMRPSWNIEAGEVVMVFGTKQEGKIVTAFGVRPMNRADMHNRMSHMY